MTQTLRLLIVEDVEDDALLLLLELQKGGVDPDYLRVETAEELKAALESGPWDAVFSDYSLPSFTGLDALRIMHGMGMDLPFILVSGAIGEEQAIEALKAGAHDLILKGQYARLISALERALKDAALRRERMQTAEELSRYRENLEDLVQHRTEELAAANQVLQEQSEELRESEERYRAIFEQAAVGIGEVNPDGRLLRVNRKLCEILGYTEEELNALPIGEITHPHDLEDSMKHFQLLLESKLGNYFLEKRYIRKDGTTIWVNLTVSAISDAGGNLKFAVGIVEDITERKQAEEQIERMNTELEAANRDLEAFNYTVAHDLRNPLNVISSYCQIFKELCGNQLQEECLGYVQEAYNGVLRMNRLIDALLKFSRMGHVELRREMVDLSGMAQVVAAELKLTKHERQVDFRIADGIAADADANMLRVVLDNLLGNAWKYTGKREEAVIEFGATEIAGESVYFVRDNGAGFDKENAAKLFAPFQRLPGAEEFRGFGIGLATVERIIRRHGGRIWAEGEPDKGATFYFTL